MTMTKGTSMRRKSHLARLACRALALITVGAASAAAIAEDAAGCDQFAWPVTKERQLFTEPGLASASSGAALTALPSAGIAIALLPGDKIAFPLAPGKAPKDPASMGGFVVFSEQPKPGVGVSDMISAMIASAISGGFMAPMSSPTGLRIVAMKSAGQPAISMSCLR